MGFELGGQNSLQIESRKVDSAVSNGGIVTLQIYFNNFLYSDLQMI
jgi:hypothetical protein